MFIIGIDPHPASHTAAVLDANGKVLGCKTVANQPAEIEALVAWGQDFPERRWAVEGASHPFSQALCAHLLSAGEVVHHIHPSLTSQYRSRQTKAKNDEIDAQNVARVLWANPDLPEYHPSVAQRTLQVLTRTRAKLAGQLKANVMSLKQLPVDEPFQAVRKALGEVIDALKAAIKDLETQMRLQVAEQQPHLLQCCGIGTVLAATILSEVGDVHRFRNRDGFARYCGAAPVQRGSGTTLRWCVNTGGNRRLNSALYLIVLTRMRCEERTRTYVDKHRALGKSPRAIIRNLKTVVARELFTLLHRNVFVESASTA